MKVEEYQKESYFAIPPHKDNNDEVLHWITGLSEEVGEVASLVKHWMWHGETEDKMRLAEECGDVLWYLSALCTARGINLDAVAQLSVAKLKHRYPDEVFDAERSVNRKQSDGSFKQSADYQRIARKVVIQW